MPPVLLMFGALAIAVLALLLVGKIVEYLWNTTVPDLFSLRRIAYWEAVRLLLLTTLLFGGLNWSIRPGG